MLRRSEFRSSTAKCRQFLPEITSATRIVDYRAAAHLNQPAEYYVTNAAIIEDPEQAVSQLERQREEYGDRAPLEESFRASPVDKISSRAAAAVG